MFHIPHILTPRIRARICTGARTGARTRTRSRTRPIRPGQRLHPLAVAVLAMAWLMLTAPGAHAQDSPVEDHPLVSRYAGAAFRESAVVEFGEYVIPVAPLVRNRLSETITREGRITQLQYMVENRSTLEVFRNYQQALRTAGFELLFEHQADSWNPTMYWVQRVYDPHGIYWKSSRSGSFVGNGFRFLAARLADPRGDAYVTLYLTPTRDESVVIQLDVIELTAMDAGMISVDVNYLRSEIERTGTVTLHGLQFYPDSAQITETSQPLLEEVADFLRAHPEARFYVVGHTTTLGPHENLMRLSQQRAQACVDALVRHHGIDADRLFAAGVGGLAPAATNATEEGRALNRRVELVMR